MDDNIDDWRDYLTREELEDIEAVEEYAQQCKADLHETNEAYRGY